MTATHTVHNIIGSIRLDRLSLGYGGKAVVENVSGTIAECAMLAVVGSNGAGKTTLLKALAGLHRPVSGTIHRSASAAMRPAYMPQQSVIDRTFPMSVLDFVTMGLWREIGLWKPVAPHRIDRAREALASVGLRGLERQRVGTLSGGQLRRALFARTTLQDSRLILLDEPFAGIDTATAEDLLATVLDWHAQGRTVIAALHDLDQVRTHFSTALLLARRMIAWGETATVLTDANFAMARVVCASANDDSVGVPKPAGTRADV